MSIRSQLEEQITGALANAEFPINTPEELLNAFPDGAETTCRAGDIEMTAGEAGKVLTTDDFPFNTPGDVANTILDRCNI